MNIGFTGTQTGLTTQQSNSLLLVISTLFESGYTRAIHGDCIGADASFHAACQAHGGFVILIFPGIAADGTSPKRAYCEGAYYLYERKPYLERNRDIVDAADVLIVCPKEREEQIRSGTWSTYRTAQKLGKSCVIIYPDGEIKLK